MKTVRTVSVERDGRTHTYDEAVRLPRDADAAVWRGALGITALVVAGAITWSTVSIGSLLAYAAPVWTSYLVAAVFDLAWITCMMLEYLARFDPAKAAWPRNAGWAFLAVSMSLIVLHGALHGGGRALAAGIAGAFVALLSKAMWHLTMRHKAVRMDAPTAAWLAAEANEAGAALAVTARMRELNRSRARVAAERAALDSAEEPRPAAKGTEAPRTGPDDAWLAASGWTKGPRDGWSAPDRPRPSVPAARSVVRSLSSARGPLAVVRECLDRDPSASEADQRTAVLEEFPDANPETITKAIYRARTRRTTG